MLCPNCGRNQARGKFCTYCGSALNLECPKCGRNQSKGKYCTYCGTRLDDGEINFNNSGVLLKSNVSAEVLTAMEESVSTTNTVDYSPFETQDMHINTIEDIVHESKNFELEDDYLNRMSDEFITVDTVLADVAKESAEKIPVYEESVEDTPVHEEPVYEELVEDEPVYEEPVYEEPVYEEPVYEEPAYEEPVYEEPVYEEPVYEEPVYEEPVYEEPVYEEPVYEEPAYEEPVYEEPVEEEPVEDTPVYEEPVYEEPVYEESIEETPVYEETDYSKDFNSVPVAEYGYSADSRRAEDEKTDSNKTSEYFDIDPMFGPLPEFTYTAHKPTAQKTQKDGFFKKKFGKK